MRRAALLALALLGFGLGLLFGPVVRAGDDGCRPYPIGPDSPTGIVGCHEYGVGIASWYHGTSAARNDCEWPWTHCQPITIRSLDTGITITVVPAMFGDLYTGTSRQRLVDLTPDQVRALGLSLSSGLFRVEVLPTGATVPDTAMALP